MKFHMYSWWSFTGKHITLVFLSIAVVSSCLFAFRHVSFTPNSDHLHNNGAPFVKVQCCMNISCGSLFFFSFFDRQTNLTM